MFRSSAQVSVNAFALTRPVMAMNSSTSRSSKATHPARLSSFKFSPPASRTLSGTEYIGKTQRAIPPEPLRVRFRELVAPLFSQIGTRGPYDSEPSPHTRPAATATSLWAGHLSRRSCLARCRTRKHRRPTRRTTSDSALRNAGLGDGVGFGTRRWGQPARSDERRPPKSCLMSQVTGCARTAEPDGHPQRRSRIAIESLTRNRGHHEPRRGQPRRVRPSSRPAFRCRVPDREHGGQKNGTAAGYRLAAASRRPTTFCW